MQTSTAHIQLGLRENLWQFTLLVMVNGFVDAMLGLERSILPAIAEQEFHLVGKTALLTFIIVFGLAKACTNYFAGRFADHFGRKKILVLGWLISLPVPFLLMWAPTWSWILFANLLLGVSQGLTWSITVIMKIDLVGKKHRGLAMGLNEFAGYIAVAGSALVTGYIATRFGLRPYPFYLGVVYAGLGALVSWVLVQETSGHVQHESSASGQSTNLSQREIFFQTTAKDRNLSSITQAGLVNNLNDGMAWGLFPLLFAAAGLSLKEAGWLVALYPATWGVTQLWTGHLSDLIGRKWLIACGMWVQAAGIIVTVLASGVVNFAAGGIMLGIGTAMVYPTLLAAIGDVVHASWRSSAVGVYRFWRDAGYPIGALVAGLSADLLGIASAGWIVGTMTFLSGCLVMFRMEETLKK